MIVRSLRQGTPGDEFALWLLGQKCVTGLPPAVDPFCAYGEDEPYLLAPTTTGPRVGTAEILLGELFDVLGPAFSGDVDYAPANREVASGVVRVGDGNGHARVTLDVAGPSGNPARC
jgi:hypothetical protein